MQPVAKKRWHVMSSISPEAEKNLEDYPSYLRQILFNRGISLAEEAKAYLEAQTPHNTDPYQISDMDVLVERLEYAVREEELIAVYGDYDVDGVTATTLLVQALQQMGARVREYIPNRFDEGYGLNNDALDSLQADGVSLVITVDCGIRSLDEAEHARKIGLDLAISDHHHPGDELPDALAVINPKKHGDAYPDKDLAGVGLAYKIVQALLARQGNAVAVYEDGLDLVALGTVADLAPLTGENRALVRAGLERIRNPRRQGLASLAQAAGLNLRSTSAMDIGFVLGPRLNAAGRLESALDAFQLLTTEDLALAGKLAQKLDSQNRERQRLTRETQTRAEELVMQGREDALLLFAVDPGFNPGIVGLAASRLSDTYYRPSIVGAKMEDVTRASCRSIPEFHITEALDRCADLLVHYGGHAAAAGFTVRNENLEELIERLQAIAIDELGGMDLRPVEMADLEIPLGAVNFGVLKHLEKLQPTGYGNSEAVFISRDAKIRYAKSVGADKKHLKLVVADQSSGIAHDAIAFGKGALNGYLSEQVDLLYTLERNEYQGMVSLQLRVKDIKPAGEPD
jgi:single-stranded-DNA-specific exonuclease